MKTCFRQRLTGALGYPIDENPSPEMYEAGYKALGIPWRYQLMEVKPENLKAALEGIRALGFEGVNLTIPHKIAAVAYMDRLSESARLIGAINTVINRNGELIGDNTDGKGFIIGMEKRGVSLEGKRIVLLGAGGAARAIAVECALAGAKELTVAARREEPGKELCQGYTEYGLLQVFIYQMGAGTPNSGLRYINKCYEFRAVSGFGVS